jgi:hypothetical protein
LNHKRHKRRQKESQKKVQINTGAQLSQDDTFVPFLVICYLKSKKEVYKNNMIEFLSKQEVRVTGDVAPV